MAIIEKRRKLDGSGAEMYNLIGQVAGKHCILVDDEIDTAGTIMLAAEFLKREGGAEVSAVATHPVFSGQAIERLADDVIDRVIVANTLPLTEAAHERLGAKLSQISVGSLIGETIRRIHQGISVGAMFPH